MTPGGTAAAAGHGVGRRRSGRPPGRLHDSTTATTTGVHQNDTRLDDTNRRIEETIRGLEPRAATSMTVSC